MNQDMIITLISLISGGGITALIKVFIDSKKYKRDEKHQETDDRITSWKDISSHYQARIETLEQKLEACNRDISSLENYVNTLERIILNSTVTPRPELPDRPILDRGRSN